MAYNNYQSPYAMNGYYYPQAPMFTPYNTYPFQSQNQINQPVQQNQQQFTNVWFNGGENDARMWPVGPNNAVALWSETEPVIYLKKADASGKPEFKIYDISERQSNSNVANDTTKDDLSALVGIVKDLSNTIAGVKSDIEVMKGDIYGIAGKKKTTARKTEVEDDA